MVDDKRSLPVLVVEAGPGDAPTMSTGTSDSGRPEASRARSAAAAAAAVVASAVDIFDIPMKTEPESEKFMETGRTLSSVLMFSFACILLLNLCVTSKLMSKIIEDDAR